MWRWHRCRALPGAGASAASARTRLPCGSPSGSVTCWLREILAKDTRQSSFNLLLLAACILLPLHSLAGLLLLCQGHYRPIRKYLPPSVSGSYQSGLRSAVNNTYISSFRPHLYDCSPGDLDHVLLRHDQLNSCSRFCFSSDYNA